MWEWAFDGYDESWYSNASATEKNARNATAASDRVIRGGGWNSDDYGLRAAYRDYYYPDLHYYEVGLRCARTP